LKTAYLTDNFSTLGGLGSVAYGDPEYFREVQNQIHTQSPTRFADIQRPSDAFESLMALNEDGFTQRMLQSLDAEYALDGEFADYIDTTYGPDWKTQISTRLYPVFKQTLDSNSTYSSRFSDYLNMVLMVLLPGFEETESLARKSADTFDNNSFSPVGVGLASQIISNNPQTKISVPPPDAIIPLESSVDLGLDYRGVSFVTGYSTLEDYWSNIPYPGVTDANLVPATLKDSILDGYIGYSSTTPLESVYNPIGAESVNNFNLASGGALNFQDPFGGGSILAELPSSTRNDANVYSISLIGDTLNGYKTFDPSTMSNGDLTDRSLIPNFEEQNADPGGGLPGPSRAFAPPF
jgi:hypothetical protein